MRPVRAASPRCCRRRPSCSPRQWCRGLAMALSRETIAASSASAPVGCAATSAILASAAATAATAFFCLASSAATLSFQPPAARRSDSTRAILSRSVLSLVSAACSLSSASSVASRLVSSSTCRRRDLSIGQRLGAEQRQQRASDTGEHMADETAGPARGHGCWRIGARSRTRLTSAHRAFHLRHCRTSGAPDLVPPPSPRHSCSRISPRLPRPTSACRGSRSRSL